VEGSPSPPQDLANATRERLGDLKNRKSITAMSDEEIAAFREAIRAAVELRDSRGYGHFASIHGIPDPGFCEHRNQLFLPWHRGYLYFLEQALQDLAPGVALPWWDWTEANEIPDAYADDGDNPLGSAPIELPGGERDPNWPERTFRAPSDFETWLPGGELPTAELVDAIVENAANFDDLTFALEDIHNAVHMWVGGTMQSQAFAAWDPIFWAHHTMVDRVWALWQLQHPGDGPRAEHLPKGLNYFKDMTVADTLNVTDLGYDYAVAEVLVHGGP
jgi:tyrosinase